MVDEGVGLLPEEPLVGMDPPHPTAIAAAPAALPARMSNGESPT